MAKSELIKATAGRAMMTVLAIESHEADVQKSSEICPALLYECRVADV